MRKRMMWALHPGVAFVERYLDLWQALNTRYYSAHPLLDMKFVAPLYECFGHDGVMLLSQIEPITGETVGLTLVERTAIGMWQLFMPSQASMGLMLIDGRLHAQAVRASLHALMRSLPGYALQIGFQNQDPLYSYLISSESDECIEQIEGPTTTFIDVEGDFQRFWSARHKKIRQDVRRFVRRLEQDGIAWQLRSLRESNDMSKGVRDHGTLESTGWKGKDRTAIHGDNVQGKFYTSIMQNFARVNSATIYQLLFNEKLVASLLTITQNGMLVVLKTSYDEAHARLSPGRLIDYLMLERVFNENQVRRIENYTNASAADARWCSGTRTLCHLNHYRAPWIRTLVNAGRPLVRPLRRQFGIG